MYIMKNYELLDGSNNINYIILDGDGVRSDRIMLPDEAKALNYKPISPIDYIKLMNK